MEKNYPLDIKTIISSFFFFFILWDKPYPDLHSKNHSPINIKNNVIYADSRQN